MNILFPRLAIEWRNVQRADGIRVEAVRVDTDAFGVRPRHVKRLDAAMPAKVMLRDTGIERIGIDIVCAAQQPEFALRYDQVQVTAHPADAAIALVGIDISRRFNLEAHPAAVTTTFMNCH